jgi:hypothetical protein
MADIETDGPVIRRFMNRLAVTAVLVAQRTSIGSTPDPDPIRTVRHRRCCGPLGRDAWFGRTMSIQPVFSGSVQSGPPRTAVLASRKAR